MSKKHPTNAKLRLPTSHAVRFEILALGRNNPIRGMAAALGVCWVHHGRPSTKYNHHDPAAFGGAVLDELLARPSVDFAAVMEAGAKAYAMLGESILTEEELGDPGNPDPADGTNPSS